MNINEYIKLPLHTSGMLVYDDENILVMECKCDKMSTNDVNDIASIINGDKTKADCPRFKEYDFYKSCLKPQVRVTHDRINYDVDMELFNFLNTEKLGSAKYKLSDDNVVKVQDEFAQYVVNQLKR